MNQPPSLKLQPTVEEECRSAVGLVVIVNVILAAILALCSALGIEQADIFLLVGLAQVGWTQLFYLPIMAFRFKRQGRRNKAKGYGIVSAALFTLTGACNGWMMWS